MGVELLKTDPELKRQLDAAKGTDDSVAAVLMLEEGIPADEKTVSADHLRLVAKRVLDRVAKRVGVTPTTVNVLSNLGVVVVSAREPFVRELLDQPEFASAMANEPAGHASD